MSWSLVGVKGLRHWSCNQLVSGSSPPHCCSLSLFLVALGQIVGHASYFGQLVCLWPVKIFKVQVYSFHLQFVSIGPKKPQ